MSDVTVANNLRQSEVITTGLNWPHRECLQTIACEKKRCYVK